MEDVGTKRAAAGLSSPEHNSRGIGWYSGWVVLIAFAGFIIHLFYFRGYVAHLHEDSSSFTVEMVRAVAHGHPDASVIVLGNSTAAEGFLPNYFNARAGNRVALNLGVPGGSVYLFDRVAEMAVREGVHPRTIILMLTPEVLADNPATGFMMSDLRYLKTILNARDLVRLGAYSRDAAEYATLAGPVVLRPILFRADLRDFLSHPVARQENARRVTEFLNGLEHGSAMPEIDNPFAVCEAEPLDTLPAKIEAARREGNPHLPNLERVEQGYEALRNPQWKIEAFHIERLRRLLRGLAATRAAVYIALAPLYDPQGDQFPAAYQREFENELRNIVRGVPGVTLLPAFEADCSMMADTIHLNRKGGELFTDFLRTHALGGSVL